MKNLLSRITIRRYDENGKIPRAQKLAFLCIFVFFLQKSYFNSREGDWDTLGSSLDRVTEIIPVAAIVTAIYYLCWLGFVMVFNEWISRKKPDAKKSPSPSPQSDPYDTFDGMREFLDLIKNDAELHGDMELAAAAIRDAKGDDYHRQLDLWARHPNLSRQDKQLLLSIASEIRRQRQPENFFDQPVRS